MCEYSGRLVAWLDSELDAEEAAAVERHVGTCAACRDQVVVFRRISSDFTSYCRRVTATERRRPALKWLAAASGAAAIVAAAVIASSGGFERARTAPPPGPALPGATAPARPVEPATEPATLEIPQVRRIRSNRLVNRRPRLDPRSVAAHWGRADAAIEIVIPAEAVFPPGAVPEGLSFSADLTIGADGWAEGLWLRP
jgi:hypothetical protein